MLPQNVTQAISALPEIVWPPIPNDQSASLQAMLYYLEQSQWFPTGVLRESQLRQAGVLLRHAVQSVPFYAAHLADVAPCDTPGVKQWEEIPLLTRSNIQQAGETLLSNRLPPAHGKVFKTQTSGSTGRNVVVYGSDLTQHFWNVLTIREHLWHRRSLDEMHAIIRVFENMPAEGRQNPDWGTPFNHIWQTGPSAMLNLLTDVREQAAWLKHVNPGYLLTYPSNLAALLEMFDTAGERIPALIQVRTIGETLTQEIRDNCRRVWGVPIVDIYSSQEVGYIALQCPDGDCYHIQAENLLVEILDDNGNACRAGETGRVVVTSLHNFAAPLIRYEIGDYAEVAGPCRCGRGLPAIRRILGRRRNLITLPTGERFCPIFGVRKFFDIAPVRQYQVIQTALDQLEVRLVVDSMPTTDQEKRLRDVICDAIGYPMAISFVYPDAIPMVAGKHEEFKSEIL